LSLIPFSGFLLTCKLFLDSKFCPVDASTSDKEASHANRSAKEIKVRESRVGLVPANVRELCARGHEDRPGTAALLAGVNGTAAAGAQSVTSSLSTGTCLLQLPGETPWRHPPPALAAFTPLA
jgi:hypothetical protein